MTSRQGSEAWLEARRSRVTGTDIGALLGVNPWKSEADVAAEKMGGPGVESTLRMRIGTALEDLIAREYEAYTGQSVRRFHGLKVHPDIPWAAASPDYRVVGRRRVVEAKWTGNRRRYDDGPPQDVEAQVMWQLGCLGWTDADIAVLIGGEEFRVYPFEYDDAVFSGMVDVAKDFRERLAAGGPFAESVDSIRRHYPADDGSEITADAEVEEAVAELHRLRLARGDLEAAIDAVEVAVKARMADASRLVGDGWTITWKVRKGSVITDWQSIAQGLLRLVPEDDREPLISLHTMEKPGTRAFVPRWREDTRD